jgi:hypothetical protein
VFSSILDLFPHRFEVPLYSVDSDREDVHETDVLGVLGEHGREHACDNIINVKLQLFANARGQARIAQNGHLSTACVETREALQRHFHQAKASLRLNLTLTESP